MREKHIQLNISQFGVKTLAVLNNVASHTKIILVIINLKVVKLAKDFFKNLYSKIQEHSPYRFAEFLDTPQEDETIDKARLEILNLLKYCFFPIISLIFLMVYAGALDTVKDTTKWSEKQGSGWVMVAFIFIFIVWVFVIVHTNKKRIPHSNPHPKDMN